VPGTHIIKETYTMASATQVRTVNGIIEGVLDEERGVRIFRGVPFARPPVGDLRWRPPQPVEDWDGVRPAKEFGPRPMQMRPFGDMNFRSPCTSEDCLYLNVWAPAASDAERLPVLVYFYGGGNIAGDSSEPRYDGTSMACRGIVAVTVNYRLQVFGFFSHPELTAESPHNASGNYGYMDQQAALAWVRENIAAFGGDPDRVTIAGESAGSISVCAQMVSPLSRGLFAGAIGESGGLINPTLPAIPLEDAEKNGLEIAERVGASSLAELRAIPAEQLLQAVADLGPQRFTGVIDGHFFPKDPVDILVSGEQAKVPLLVGWNSEEMNYRALMGDVPPTVEGFRQVVTELYGEQAEEVLRLYPTETDEEVAQAATDLAGDRFISYSTWKWGDAHAQTGGQPVYRYYYCRPRPPMRPEMGDAVPGLAGGVVRGEEARAHVMPPARGAVHSAEIEYALGNLDSNMVYAWTPEDYQVSATMQSYFANFIIKGDPNGPGLPHWPALNEGDTPHLMRIDVTSAAKPVRDRERYLFHDRVFNLGR
jgi:para-nitrobenzyl esterase